MSVKKTLKQIPDVTYFTEFCLCFCLQVDRSLPGGDDSWTVTRFYGITAQEPVHGQLTTLDWPQVSGHQLRKDSSWSVILNVNPLRSSTICARCNQTLFILMFVVLFVFLNTVYCANRWDSTAVWALLAYSYSCRSKVKSRSVCGSGREEASGIYFQLSEIWELNLTTRMKEFGTSFNHFSTLIFLVLLLIRLCYVKVFECYDP